jgi:hypothetical protein
VVLGQPWSDLAEEGARDTRELPSIDQSDRAQDADDHPGEQGVARPLQRTADAEDEASQLLVHWLIAGA